MAGSSVLGGSEIAGERLRRAAFGPKIPPGEEAKLPPISGQQSSLRTVSYFERPSQSLRECLFKCCTLRLFLNDSSSMKHVVHRLSTTYP